MAEAAPAHHDRGALASAITSVVRQVVAERLPVGWPSLVLRPPLHPSEMTWHVHLAPMLHLDLEDGRAVVATPPSDGHDWTLASGRRATVSDGDPSPPPGPTTAALRVTGPYFSVQLATDAMLVRYQDRPKRGHELRVPAGDLSRLASAARQAVDAAVAAKLSGSGPTLAYSPTGWRAHARCWLLIDGR